MKAEIVCVLRSGGEFNVSHVRRLRDQIGEVAPGVPFFCLSDVVIRDVPTIALEYNWPGWWSKMELFRPDIFGDLLYLDLDSHVVGDISELLEIGQTAIMRDVYRPAGLQSSIMYLAEADRAEIWRSWVMHADEWQVRYAKGGDQAFLERHWLKAVTRWQDVLAGRIVSYKVDCAPRGEIPAGARVVAFHGKPRPWEIGL